MKKVIEINAVETGSTGRIMIGIASVARTRGFQVYTFSGERKDSADVLPYGHTRICKWFDFYFHSYIGCFLGLNEKLSTIPTIRLVNRIKEINPDIVHLHIIHGFYLNIKILFSFLKRMRIPVVWTFHDCWAFTGRCPHFVLSKCEKWRNGCNHCVYSWKQYPASFWDISAKTWRRKKKLFCGIDNLTIITPSMWLKEITEKSFLGNCSIRVINNGINTDLFFKTYRDSKNRLKDGNKKRVLGVANSWGYRKGLDVFIELSKQLDENYIIMLVGTNLDIDRILPSRIVSIHHTNNQEELAELYCSADVFVNPTREDNFPTVNIEALACGTPVLTFNTGGSPEIIDETCGSIIPVDDVGLLVKEIIRVCETEPYSSVACINRAKKYDQNERFLQYVELYEEIIRNYC